MSQPAPESTPVASTEYAYSFQYSGVLPAGQKGQPPRMNQSVVAATLDAALAKFRLAYPASEIVQVNRGGAVIV